MSLTRYQIGLGPKILSRARLVFGLLLIVLAIFTVAGIYQGSVSGEFDKVLVQPFRQFSADLGKALETKPIPSLTPILTPSPANTSNSTSTSTSTTKVIINQTVPSPQKVQQKQAQPVTPNCIRKNIREGEFASNKCYLQQDYEDLNYYLDKYNSALGSVSFYETKVRISCGNNDFFKTCEQDKKDQQANSDNIPRYKSIIQGIIAKGT
ncbi:hypothetical protein HYU95_01595 [Candidatus Daviesbacteria bacterium]|nr:hypothetical protein [Candidatus Daviesbacteria bacterium]